MNVMNVMSMLIMSMLLLVLVLEAAEADRLPNGHAWGCLNISKSLPFCNPALSIEARLTDFISRLSLQEKIGLISPDTTHTGVSSCNFMDAGVLRLGVPPYMHLVETNTAVASSCIKEGVCATNWPGPTGLGASFNRSLWTFKGNVMAEEMRAFNNLDWYRGTSDAPHSLIGLHGYGPNINLIRDPRWGRNSECPSEDPFLAGQYSKYYVTGAQRPDGDGSKFYKMTLGLKHYDAYSVETNRGSFIPNITMLHLWDSFLPQYRAGFVDGAASGAMCSYSGLNGVPSCANNYLLNTVVRDHFNRPDAVIGTDCGAVNNMVSQNHYAANKTDAAAKTLNGGTDLELGDQIWSPTQNGGSGSLEEAISKGMTTEDRVAESVRRVLRLRFLTGQFDPLDNQPYSKIGVDVINSTAHQQLTLEAAEQSFVLLKNDDNTLPFSTTSGGKLAVLGPHVNSTRDLYSDYKGDKQCFDGSYDCIPTIGDVFTRLYGASRTQVAQGVSLAGTDASGIPPAVAAAKAADMVVLCLGIGNSQEHEGMDRTTTVLPGLQDKFAAEILSLGKPTVVVFINGGIVSPDYIVNAAPAIVEAFYPAGKGAEALYRSIFGLTNKWGKMPVTMYDSHFSEQFEMTDFSMSKHPGRTYKWFTGVPLFPFGHGLSYTKYSVSAQWRAESIQGTALEASVNIQNTGNVMGDEVVMVYHSVSDDIRKSAGHPIPLRALVGFDRAADVMPGNTATLKFTLDSSALAVTDSNGDSIVYSGNHTFLFSNGAGSEATLVTFVKPADPRVGVLLSVPRME
jgi:beta-glucosidase-like glycosyl hydrolase